MRGDPIKIHDCKHKSAGPVKTYNNITVLKSRIYLDYGIPSRR